MATINFSWFSIKTKSPTKFLNELDDLCTRYESKKEKATFKFKIE